MLEFLSDNLKLALNNLNLKRVYEIRVRANSPTRVNYAGKYEFLSENGVVSKGEGAIVCTKSQIEDMIYSAGDFSVYAVEDQIKQGFLTAKHGVRIGLGGEYVFSCGQPVSIRNLTSLCIRVPHTIFGCSNEIYELCLSHGIKNLLIASLPGLGKTTILKDLIEKISTNTLKNILICDERGELSDGERSLGPTCDCIKYADKEIAFTAGLRAMRPDIIVTDEITRRDIPALRKIINSGVTIIGSAHLNSFESILANEMNFFDEYCILDEQKIGKLRYVYDKNGEIKYKNAN